MKTNRRPNLKSISAGSPAVLGAFIISCSGLWSTYATTTIGFDGLSLADGDPIPQYYADDAQTDGPGYAVSLGREFTGTPNITPLWLQGMTFRSDWDGRGAVAQIGPQNDPMLSIGVVFMSVPNFAAIVDSFDLDLRSGAGPVDVDWSFTTGGFSASGNWQRTTPGRDTIVPVYSGEPEFWGDHFFFFRINVGDPGSFAIDNLTFDQVLVPEPSTLALAMVGTLAVAAALRHRNSVKNKG